MTVLAGNNGAILENKDAPSVAVIRGHLRQVLGALADQDPVPPAPSVTHSNKPSSG